MESLVAVLSVECGLGFVSEPTSSTKAQSASPIVICGQGSYKNLLPIMHTSNMPLGAILKLYRACCPLSCMIGCIKIAQAESFPICLIPGGCFSS